MGQILQRRPVLGRLAIAACCLALLAGASWCLNEIASADFPQRPVWDLGDAGPWVASFARAVSTGSWMAAHACLVIIGLGLVLGWLGRVVTTVRRSAGRRSGSVS
ncbi:hypothetical protein DWB77_07216 [Streptomyces hundungensis]|uniref:Uncharacterized protein n=1 Tax=Streptomyces hundungensis TaxID=1077946 RepID=A0A387HPU9_9ACTN|nr:hypothetical protein [Streptomyces hundungensis]AYG85001.1 hypothetical protein DWB77_07216 [Streptomyces hundungensis]